MTEEPGTSALQDAGEGAPGSAEPETAPSGRTGSDGRRVLAAVFWLLASISIMLTSVSVWTQQTLLTSNGWGGIVEDVIADPEVTHNIAGVVVTRISDALGVQDTVAGFLPGALDIVANALTSSVEDRVIDGVADFMATDGFQQAFIDANKAAHAVAMRLIREDDRDAITAQGGLITLSIFPIIEGVLHNLQDAGLIDAGREIPDLSGFQPDAERVAQLEQLLGRDLPDDIGTITLVERDGVGMFADAVRYLETITVGLVLLTLLFIGLALWLSTSRVRMVMWLAVGAIAALALGRFLGRIVLNRATQRAQEGDAAPTAIAVVDIAVDSLMWFTFVVMAVAAVAALIAYWWEHRRTGDRASMQTPPRTLGGWARENAPALLFVGVAVIAVGVVWSVGGADVALLTAAGLGLLGVAYKVLTGGDDAPHGAAEG